MSDVIMKARPRRGARYVCMEGGDDLVCSRCDEIRAEKIMLIATIAKWPLRDVHQVELGDGSQSRRDVGA